MNWLVLCLPWIVRQPLESFFLPSELVRAIRVPDIERVTRVMLVRPYYAGFLGVPLPVRAPKTPGRNEPCSCGSGIKYKRCCGAAPRVAVGGGGS